MWTRTHKAYGLGPPDLRRSGLGPLSTLKFPMKGLSQGYGMTEAKCTNSLCESLLWETNISGPVSTSPGTCCVQGARNGAVET